MPKDFKLLLQPFPSITLGLSCPETPFLVHSSSRFLPSHAIPPNGPSQEWEHPLCQSGCSSGLSGSKGHGATAVRTEVGNKWDPGSDSWCFVKWSKTNFALSQILQEQREWQKPSSAEVKR